MPVVEYHSRVGAPADQVFAWHARAGALERLLPPWERARVVEREPGLAEGTGVVVALRKGPLALRWVVRHRDVEPGRGFADEQVQGPFASWLHRHRFVPDGPEATILEDRVEYRLPGGVVGAAIGERLVAGALRRALRFRHARIRHDLWRHAAAGGSGPLRVAITGASGLIGQSLAAFLRSGGHQVLPLVRRAPRPGTHEIAWSPDRGEVDRQALEGVDAVVHLAGESIAAGRWTAARKAAIRQSRVESTKLLSDTLATLRRPPRVLVAASATGYYGDRGAEPLDETSAPGVGFLPEVCLAWEAAAEPARRSGIRVVTLRIGLVLAARGGALRAMLRPFRLGLGGVIGHGGQYVSWIALDDLVSAVHFALFREVLAGAVNAVAPTPVTNGELTRSLGRVLGRPTVMPLPGVAVRLLLGEMGQALLLEGARVRPGRLEGAGFRFAYPILEEALRAELGLGAGD